MTWLLIAIVFLVVVLAIWQTIQLNKIRAKVLAVPRDGNVVAVMNDLGNRVVGVESDMNRIIPRLVDVEARIPHAISRTGVVAYDAFGNIAGKMSRSIALLSDLGDGLVITIIVAREETMFFTKEVRAGHGSEELSPEEQGAVDRALGR